MPKLLQFLRFTSAMDFIIDKKIEVTLIKCEGLSSRPIAHTCGPHLEILSTYATFVELMRLERVFSRTRTRARKHTRQLNDSKLAHRKLNLA